jgi:uncharacterized membrane protein YhaH (DUF805 family)
MENANPYSAPKAEITSPRETGYGEIKILTSKGRIGRLRYIGYTTGIPILLVMVMAILLPFLPPIIGQQTTMIVLTALYFFVFFVILLLTIQRSHDMNRSGWLALLMFVPLVNLLFYFIPGTKGENDHGPMPPPNGIGVILLALALPLVFVLGIVAAIALPAYQDYVNRARTQQTQ